MNSILSRTGARALLAGSFVLLLAACQTVPTTPPALAEARDALRAAESDPAVVGNAPLQLQQARDALARAERQWADDQNVDEMQTLTHIARQRVAIARAVAERQLYEARVQQAQAERERVRADVRAREAQTERQRAMTAQDQLQRQQQEATLAMESARTQAQEAAERNRRLEAELRDLQAKETTRGLVITLGDVLFDTDRAELRDGSLRSLQRIATVLRDHPERRVLIEGHTDSQGSASYNLELSERRAEAVRRALTAQGVSPSQVEVRALGQANPVASNQTAAGRQLNRRVEIIFSDGTGAFAAR
jgi:outer membrane protein OmpA-like peptidoglycan-associated protein